MKRAKGKDDGAALALYDVFLSHSNSDKPVVEGLARRLHERDIRPFLDKWHLVPGEPWQEALESALDQSSSCAVFLGSTLGPWQNEEMRAALNERARNPQFRVIPVLLPGATFSSIRDLPRFLDNLTWVDLRDGIDERGVDVLVSGIRGVAPDPDGSLSSTGVHSNVDVELRDRYLDWLIREHGTLELPGLAQLGRRPTVELETVYVALRGDLAGSHERLQSRELLEEQARNLENLSDLQQLEPDKKLRLLARLVARAPVPLSLEERDRPQLLPSTTDRREQIITLGEAFRRERRLVILGDPGSGKTTLVRWLAMQLARSCREGRATVEVPVHHVDPDASIGEETLVLGPTRVPILVRIASFAEARKLDPQLSLAAFLGHHLAPPGKQAHTVDGRTLEPQPLHEFFLGELAAGRAVLLLDGLDEINDPLDRWEIVQEIDRFLDAWLPAADELQVAESWGRKRLVGQPFRDGGLQVVITSRIVGYQMAPLSHDATHLTIEPMESRAVDRFCDVWVRANHRAAMAPSDWDQDCEDKARDEAEGLKAAIAGLHERGAADLASNPLLITILALVYQGRKGFPRQRVRLYETAVDILLDKWRLRTQSRGERALSNEQVLDVLIPLAADIHTTSAIGVIDEDQLDQALHHYLEPEAVLALRTVIRSEVGLLTARGEGVYGFLHLTFQEYLAARFLIRETSRSTQLLLDKLSAPRWREPILMAIGQLASELDEPALDELLLQMLDRPDPLGQLVPRALFLIVAALPEMRTVPNRSMEALCRRLIELASRRGTLERFPVLRQQVEGAYRQLLRYESDLSGSERIAERALCDALREPDSPSLRWAAAELVRSCRAESIELAEALSVSLEHDTEEWEWPIDRALRELKARRKDLVIGDHRSLGRALARDRELEERFLADSGWLRVGMVLYGGLDSALPQRLSRLRSQLLHLDEEVNAWQARTVTPEQQARLVELGEAKTARQEELDELQSRGYRFHIDSIHRDVPWLTPDILAALRADRSPASLVDKLRERCRDRRCPLDIYTEALLVLVALDEPIDEELHRRPRSAERLAAALSRIYRQLEPAVPSTVVPTFEMLGPAVEHCGDSDWIDLVSAVLDLVLYCGHKPQSPLVLDTAAGAAVRPHIWAEFWQQMAAWHSDDPYYNLAVVLDTNGFLAKDPMLLARSFADANVAANARWSQHRGWSLDALAPIPTTDSEVYAAALDALVTLPEPFDVLRGWVIQALAPELERLGLLPEARVIAFGSLSNRLRIREATLRRLDEIAVSDRKEASTSDATTVLDLVTTVENLADPYLRFRGYWQLIRSFSDLRLTLLVANEDGRSERGLVSRLSEVVFSLGEAFSALAPRAASEIRDLAQRVWAFERLASVVEDPGVWLEEARHAALRMSPKLPAQRARALARLAPTFPGAERQRLLKRAFDDCGRIRDERLRALTLYHLRRMTFYEPWSDARFGKILKSLRQPLSRARAQGRVAPVFQKHARIFDNAVLETTPLRLAATVHDLEKRFALPRDADGLWLHLGTERGDEALAALKELGRRDGLHLHREAAVAIGWLMETGREAAAVQLLPYIKAPGEALLPIVSRWPTANSEVAQLTSLLRSEAGDISETLIATLIELLSHADDRIRYRAAAALNSTDTNRRIRVSRLGVGATMQLARGILAYRDRSPVCQSIGWALDNLVLDDRDVLVSWLDGIETDREDRKPIEKVLGRIRHLARSTWPELVSQFPRRQAATQRLLIRSICKFIHQKSVSREMWPDIYPHIEQAAEHALAGERIRLNLPASLVASARAASASTEASMRVAREHFAESGVVLTELIAQGEELAYLELGEIGSLNVYNNAYKEKVEHAAEEVSAEPELLSVLMAWLCDELRESIEEDAFWFQYVKSDLLLVVAAAAERLPNTFLQNAQKLPSLSRLLREAAEFQSTFTGRQAAIILLSFIRTASDDALGAIRCGLGDVNLVQESTLGSLRRYRDFDRSALRLLADELYASSPVVAYSAAQILSSIAKNVHLDPETRDSILYVMAEAIDDPRSRRDVYLYQDDQSKTDAIRHIGRLEDIYFQLLLELCGVADLRTETTTARGKEAG